MDKYVSFPTVHFRSSTDDNAEVTEALAAASKLAIEEAALGCIQKSNNGPAIPSRTAGATNTNPANRRSGRLFATEDLRSAFWESHYRNKVNSLREAINAHIARTDISEADDAAWSAAMAQIEDRLKSAKEELELCRQIQAAAWAKLINRHIYDEYEDERICNAARARASGDISEAEAASWRAAMTKYHDRPADLKEDLEVWRQNQAATRAKLANRDIYDEYEDERMCNAAARARQQHEMKDNEGCRSASEGGMKVKFEAKADSSASEAGSKSPSAANDEHEAWSE